MNTNFDAMTPYPDVNAVLQALTAGVERVFGEKLVGLYLTGSLSYGDFNAESSDIDLVAILTTAASAEELALIERLHASVEAHFPKWAKRIESSYTPVEMLGSILPPQEPRPYYGEGNFYPEAGYGNEWIINLSLQYEYGITLAGADFRTLLAPIPIAEVQKACIRDLFREWEPKLAEPEWLDNPHYQSYLVLNLCRILYTVMQGSTGSKKAAAAWVKSAYPAWVALIETAEAWHYGKPMTQQTETLDFLRFVIGLVKGTALYGETSPPNPPLHAASLR